MQTDGYDQKNPSLLEKNMELEKKLVPESTSPNGNGGTLIEIRPPRKVKIIDKYFDAIGYSKYQYVQIFISSLVNIVIGVESLIPNLIVVEIQKEMNVELYQAAMLVAAFGLGAGVGIHIFIFSYY